MTDAWGKFVPDLGHLVCGALFVVWGLARFAKPHAYTKKEGRQMSGTRLAGTRSLLQENEEGEQQERRGCRWFSGWMVPVAVSLRCHIACSEDEERRL